VTIRLDHLHAGVPVLHVGGCLDELTSLDLQQLLDDQFPAAPWAIVLDLSPLSIPDRGAVPTLVQVACRASEADVGLCLVTTDGAVIQVLATADVLELFEIYPTTEAALRALTRFRE
jgi:anti-sigma B factor antagonist